MTMNETHRRFFGFLTKMDLMSIYTPDTNELEILFGGSHGNLFNTTLALITYEDARYRFDDERESELVTAVNLKKMFS